EEEVRPDEESGGDGCAGDAIGERGDDRLLIERAGEESEVGGVVQDGVAGAELGAGICKGGPGYGDARRDGDAVEELIPVSAHAGVDVEIAEQLTVVVGVDCAGGVRTVEDAAAAEGGLGQGQAGEADRLEAGAAEIAGVVDPFRAGAELKLMAPGEV